MYSETTTQYAIDENIPNNQQDLQGIGEKVLHNYEAKSNDEFEEKMLKEDKCNEKPKEEAVDIGESSQRFSGVSDFSEVDCGEPATGQHLIIHFASTEEDNIELENKCRSFWKFIESHPHLEKIKILPTNDTEREEVEQEVLVKKNMSEETSETAMQWVQRGDMVKSAMRTKFNTSFCDFGGGDYCEERKTKTRELKSRSDGHKGKSLSGRRRVPSTDELKTICRCMDEWDAAYLRCVDSLGYKNVYNITL